MTPVVGPDEAASQRRSVIARMETLQGSALSRRASAHTVRRRLSKALAAVALLASVAGAYFFHERGVAPPQRENSQRVYWQDGATLKLNSGATVELLSASELRLLRDEPTLEEISLQRGHIDVRVPKLAKGALLVVQTPDTRVTVRGTRFTVKYGDECVRNPCTAVHVSEGRVEVDHGGAVTTLSSGDSWTSESRSVPDAPPVARAIPSPPAPSPPAAAEATRPTAAEAAPHRRQAAASAHANRERPSTLAEENALLESAMASSRAGSAERAVSLLDEHIRKYPASPLARNAELERLRALDRGGDPASARAAARRYLAKYPDGMGADEARRIAVRSRAPERSPPSAP